MIKTETLAEFFYLEILYGTNGVKELKYKGKEYYYFKNIQGDVIGILDSNGEIVVKYRYDAWGNHQVEDLSGINLGEVNPFRYRSYYYDSETGLFYVESRYYDPEIGRFINADDISYLDPQSINGLNLYAYCLNNPVMYLDPDGNMPWWCKILIGVVIIAALAIATIATGGAAGGVAGFILAGALKGAIFGAISGRIINGLIGGLTTGSWKGALEGFSNGFLAGAIIGGITGAASNAIKVVQAAKAWSPTSMKSSFRVMVEHYGDHVIKEGQQAIAKNIVNYTIDAQKFFINNSASAYTIGVNALKIAGAPGGIFTTTGLIKSFWYILL